MDKYISLQNIKSFVVSFNTASFGAIILMLWRNRMVVVLQ